MRKVRLKDIVDYSKERISYKELSIDTYISTDNLLQNKQGVVRIDKLPTSENNTSKYSKGNILVSNIRPYLKKIYYAKTCGGVSADVLNFTIKSGFDSKYIYYNLFQDRFFDHMMASSKGTKMPRGDKAQILNFEINIPNLQNQQKIASVLSALDDKIEINNKINAELEALAKTLYDYWFVQFEFPNTDGKPYKSSGGKMVYNPTLKREIPEGWEMRTVGDLSTILIRGISPIYVEIESEGIVVLNQKCVRDFRVKFEFQRRHNDTVKNASTKLVKKYDVLVNSTGVGTLGRVALVRWLNEEKVTVDSHVTILRTEETKLSQIFFGYSLLTKQSEIENFANGSTGQVELNRNQLSDVNIVLPPKELQSKFSDYYDLIIEKTSINEQQNQEIAQLRDWLLPMLMNGQVKVEDAEEQVLDMVAEPSATYEKVANTGKIETKEDRFELWLSNQKLAARGDIDKVVLREIFDSMDDEDQ